MWLDADLLAVGASRVDRRGIGSGRLQGRCRSFALSARPCDPWIFDEAHAQMVCVPVPTGLRGVMYVRAGWRWTTTLGL